MARAAARRAGATLLGGVVLVLGVTGCASLPATRLARCHQHAQALQAEMAVLKDEALRLRVRNRDLADRAVEDAQRIQALEQERARLGQSLVAYQSERDAIAEAFAALQDQLRTAAAEGPRQAALEAAAPR